MIKSRSASTGPAPAPPQSIDAIRRRARHRLIGASMLVLVGVVGFSLLFDTQPRPLAVDIPIEIPAKSAPAPTPLPLEPTTAKAPVPAESVDQAATASTSAPQAAASQPVDVPETAPAPPPPPTELPAAPPPVLAPAAPVAEARTEPPAQPAGAVAQDNTLRLVVQVGAFAENARAQEVRRKIEAAGMKTYTHVADTAQGRRIRVRLGPFSNRPDAEKAAARVKALGLPAAILTL